jgi:protein CMS1
LRNPNKKHHKQNTTNTMSTTKKRQAEDTPAQPKPKKNKKRKANAPDDELLDTELGLNTLFTKMDNQLLADHLAQKLGRFGGDLSAVEISDMTVSGTTHSFSCR